MVRWVWLSGDHGHVFKSTLETSWHGAFAMGGSKWNLNSLGFPYSIVMIGNFNQLVAPGIQSLFLTLNLCKSPGYKWVCPNSNCRAINVFEDHVPSNNNFEACPIFRQPEFFIVCSISSASSLLACLVVKKISYMNYMCSYISIWSIRFYELLLLYQICELYIYNDYICIA
jgi:hypothetical protein